MLFDSLMLARIATDLRRLAVGARVERVFLAAPDEVVLELRRKLPRPQLLISWSAQFGRAHLAGTAEPRPDLHLPVGDVLRKHLRGATLVDARQVGFDRLLRVEFANCGGMGPQSRATLVGEIMGRHANLVLLDPQETIIACAKHISAAVNRYRETLPGLEYIPPPDFGRLDPHRATPEALAAMAAQAPDTPLRDVLRKGLMGASDVFLAELMARADVNASQAPPQGEWPERVGSALAEMLAVADANGPTWVHSGGGESLAYPLALLSRPDLVREETDDLSEAVEGLVAAQRLRRRLRERRERLLGFARRALKKAAATEQARRRTLASAEQADDLRRRGELILANLHAIAHNTARVTVTDYYDPAQPAVEIELDPHYSPQDNAKALFDRYKRARRIQERVPPLLARATMQREYLEGVLDQLEAAETPQEMDELERELDAGGHIGRQVRRKARAQPIAASEPRRIASADGLAILYGTTGTQNDALVRMADGDDIWLHVREGPGGHVLIRTGGRPDAVPETTLHEAAAIAAAHSRQRADTRVEVAYTLAKHVRKPRGAPPGFVTYSEAKTVVVTPAGQAQG